MWEGGEPLSGAPAPLGDMDEPLGEVVVPGEEGLAWPLGKVPVPAGEVVKPPGDGELLVVPVVAVAGVVKPAAGGDWGLAAVVEGVVRPSDDVGGPLGEVPGGEVPASIEEVGVPIGEVVGPVGG